MKHLVAACFLLLASSALAQARLGWTLQECEAKYGPASIVVPTGKHFKDSSTEATLRFEGWQIRAAWFAGGDRAQFIHYMSDTPRMTNEQMDAILKANSGGQK